MPYKLVITKRVDKQIAAIPKQQRMMVLAWMKDNLMDCENPKAVYGGKAIQGTENGWRYRVGSYRILVRILDEELMIETVRVGHRQGVYGNLPKM